MGNIKNYNINLHMYHPSKW